MLYVNKHLEGKRVAWPSPTETPRKTKWAAKGKARPQNLDGLRDSKGKLAMGAVRGASASSAVTRASTTTVTHASASSRTVATSPSSVAAAAAPSSTVARCGIGA